MKKLAGYVLRVLSLCACLTLLRSLSCNAADDPYFFIFGDSLYDTGNNVMFVTDFPSASCPYGMSYFHKPAGRLSDGRLIPDFIAIKLGLPFIPPFMDNRSDFTHGANFASAGSGVSSDHPDCINLPVQYINYTKLVNTWRTELGNDEADKRLMKAVYLISTGGNDYFSYASNQPNASFRQMQEHVNEITTNFSKVIKDMYDNGGARKFMFQAVSPLGCLPVMKTNYNISDGCARPPLTLATLHNNALPAILESIKNSPGYSEFTYSIFDFFTLLGERIRVPEDYDFKVGGEPCYVKPQVRGTERWSEENPVNCTNPNGEIYTGDVCTNPEDYVFFDDGHNTDKLNNQLAELLWSGGPDVVYPYNMKQLFEYDPAIKICSKNKALCSG